MNSPRLEPEPSDRKVLLSAIAWLGVIFCFFLVVAVAYLPNRAVSQEARDAAIRYQIRDEVRGEQARLVESYEWINPAEGVVRLPVERAMRLTVEELRARQLPNAVPAR